MCSSISMNLCSCSRRYYFHMLNHSQGFINRRQLLQTAGGGIGSWALSHLFNADQVRAEEEGSSPPLRGQEQLRASAAGQPARCD